MHADDKLKQKKTLVINEKLDIAIDSDQKARSR